MVEYNVNLEGKTVLVTGAAGFIGSNLVRRLFHDVKDIKVIGIDSITDYYDVNIKYERLKEIKQCLSVIVDQKSEMDENGVESGFYQGQNGSIWTFVHASIADMEAVEAVEKISTENYIAVESLRSNINKPPHPIDGKHRAIL